VDYDACANLGKHRVVCGFSWLLRVIDHEAVPVDPKLFSSWVHRLVVLLKRGFGRQTSSRWHFSRKNDWVVGSASNSVASDGGFTGALYSEIVIRWQKLVMAFFTTALGLNGGVLWSGELQGLIVHEMVPVISYGLWLDWATIRFRVFGPSSFNTALQLVLRPHFLVHFV
jgi:hypothetical protein